MGRHVQQPQPQSNKDLILPRADQFLEFSSIVSKKEQNDTKDKSGLVEVDESKLVKAETENFIVYGSSKREADIIAQQAEACLKDLNKEWFENRPINWKVKVKIIANVDDNLVAGGETKFTANKRSGELLAVRTRVQGTPERVLDSVIPHELSHMLVATNFAVPFVRWADEGIASFSESNAERRRLGDIILSDSRRIDDGQVSSLETFDKILVRVNYPEDKLELFKFYAKSLALTEFLIEREGKDKFIKFLKEANPKQTDLQHWNKLLLKHYGINGSTDLEKQWRKWVRDKMND